MLGDERTGVSERVRNAAVAGVAAAGVAGGRAGDRHPRDRGRQAAASCLGAVGRACSPAEEGSLGAGDRRVLDPLGPGGRSVEGDRASAAWRDRLLAGRSRGRAGRRGRARLGPGRASGRRWAWALRRAGEGSSRLPL